MIKFDKIEFRLCPSVPKEFEGRAVGHYHYGAMRKDHRVLLIVVMAAYSPTETVCIAVRARHLEFIGTVEDIAVVLIGASLTIFNYRGWNENY